MNILDVHPGKSLKDLGNETVSGFQNTASLIILYFPMFPFDLPEKIKPEGFMFSGGSKGNIGKKRVSRICSEGALFEADFYLSVRLQNTCESFYSGAGFTFETCIRVNLWIFTIKVFLLKLMIFVLLFFSNQGS